MDKLLQIVLGVIAMLIVIASSGYGATMWAKCVYNEKILPCKLIDDRVIINGKDMNVSKVDAISLDGVVYVLLKERR